MNRPTIADQRGQATVAPVKPVRNRSRTPGRSKTPTPPDSRRSHDIQQEALQYLPQHDPRTTSVRRAGTGNAARLVPNGDFPISVHSATPSPTDLTNPNEQLFRFQRQQEEMRQREEEILNRREQARREQEAIAKRQQEADQAERAIRQTIAVNNPGLISTTTPSSLNRTPSRHTAATPSSSSYSIPTPTSSYSVAPSTPGFTPVKPRGQFLEPGTPSIMPLESPSKYDDYATETDSETVPKWRAETQKRHPVEYPKTLTRVPARRCVYAYFQPRVSTDVYTKSFLSSSRNYNLPTSPRRRAIIIPTANVATSETTGVLPLS